MLEIETAISALTPPAQRRVVDWIRARWQDPAPATNGNGHAKANGNGEPQFAIRGTPLTSSWPHESSARAERYRRGILEGGIGDDDVESMLSDADEAELLSVKFDAGPNEETTALFQRLATDEEYRNRMVPPSQASTFWAWWRPTATMLSHLNAAELAEALRRLSEPETYKALRRDTAWEFDGSTLLERLGADGVSPAGATEPEGVHALDIAQAVAGVRRGGIDPAVWTTQMAAEGRDVPLDAFADQLPRGVLSADDEIDEASAMLDEADWASGLLGRLRSSNPSTLVCALQELEQPGAMERLTNITSTETVDDAIRSAKRRYPDGTAGKAHPVEDK